MSIPRSFLVLMASLVVALAGCAQSSPPVDTPPPTGTEATPTTSSATTSDPTGSAMAINGNFNWTWNQTNLGLSFTLGPSPGTTCKVDSVEAFASSADDPVSLLAVQVEGGSFAWGLIVNAAEARLKAGPFDSQQILGAEGGSGTVKRHFERNLESAVTVRYISPHLDPAAPMKFQMQVQCDGPASVKHWQAAADVCLLDEAQGDGFQSGAKYSRVISQSTVTCTTGLIASFEGLILTNDALAGSGTFGPAAGPRIPFTVKPQEEQHLYQNGTTGSHVLYVESLAAQSLALVWYIGPQ